MRNPILKPIIANSPVSAPFSVSRVETDRILKALPHPPKFTGGVGLPANAVKPARSHIRQAHELAVQGVRFAASGKHALAIERLRRSIELDPAVSSVHHDLGLTYLYQGRLDEATLVFAQAIRLSPDIANVHLNLGNTLDHLGREREAVTAYETAVRLDPGLHAVFARIGQIYLSGGNRIEAEALFRKAASAAATTAPSTARVYEAYAVKIAGAEAESERLLRDLIAADADFGEAYIALGQLLAERGLSEEAAACFERGMVLDQTMISWNQLATNKKFKAEDRHLIDQMLKALDRPGLRILQRQSIQFALAKAYDDLKDHGAAISHLEAANKIRGSRGRFDRATLSRQTDHVIACAPPGFLDLRRDFGVPSETPVLIVGMPRSGTTLVEQIISSHPDVASGGELPFWRERNVAGLGVFDAKADVETVHHLAADYLQVLHDISSDASRVTDKLPFNFAYLGVIRQVFPNATIVHCRRNPIDTCLSIFSTEFQVAFDFASDRSNLVFFYREYLRLMDHWRKVLPSNRFIEVDYEQLVADPEPLTRRLIAACGLNWNDACLQPHRNQRSIITASLWQARQPIYRTSVERWRRYEPWLGALRELLPEAGDRVQGPVDR